MANKYFMVNYTLTTSVVILVSVDFPSRHCLDVECTLCTDVCSAQQNTVEIIMQKGKCEHQPK